MNYNNNNDVRAWLLAKYILDIQFGEDKLEEFYHNK